MRRWLVFAGQYYYPQSGAGDFVKAFDTEYEAFQVARALASGDPYDLSPRDGYSIDWVSVHYLNDNGDLETFEEMENPGA